MSEFNQPPDKESPIPGMATHVPGPKTGDWRARPYDSAAGRAGVAKFMLIACVLWLGVFIWSTSLQLSLLNDVKNGVQITQAEAESNDNRQLLVGGVFGLLMLISGITFWRWQYRAYQNLGALQAKDVTSSPGWTIGYYFIPIMNLFKPYQLMREISQGSDPNRLNSATAALPKSNVLAGWWWILWLVFGIGNRVASRMPMETVDQLIMSDWVTLGCDVIGIISGVFCVFLISLVTQDQEARASLIAGKTGPHEFTHPPQ